MRDLGTERKIQLNGNTDVKIKVERKGPLFHTTVTIIARPLATEEAPVLETNQQIKDYLSNINLEDDQQELGLDAAAEQTSLDESNNKEG